MADIEQIALSVLDNAFHCSDCENRIKRVLKRLPGVITVTADQKTQRVSIALDTAKTPLPDVKQALESAGYPTA